METCLNNHNDIKSRKSFVTIIVDEIDKILYNLKKQFNFIFNNFDDFKSILVEEPSFNLLQIVQHKKGFKQNMNAWDMISNWKIHHINLESHDVRKSIHFFSNIIGINEGKWITPKNMGDFSVDRKQLALLSLSDNNRGIHIIKADHGFGWRNNFVHNPSIGGHPAITVKNISQVIKKLKQKSFNFRC